jgi:hypothetical protein
VGFNNNVKHRGRVFHIQTEDSGVARPHITTHLFADGGLILKSCRTDYSDVLQQPDMVAILRKRMKDQHKAMFIDLREGKLDPIIDEILVGPLEKSVQAVGYDSESKLRQARSQPAIRRSSHAPAGRGGATSSSAVPSQAVPSPALASAARAASGISSALTPSHASTSPLSAHAGAGHLRSTTVPASRLSQQAGSSSRYAATRPSPSFDAPDASSIFGGSSISEQSLDDVILSYISADLDGNSNTGE